MCCNGETHQAAIQIINSKVSACGSAPLVMEIDPFPLCIVQMLITGQQMPQKRQSRGLNADARMTNGSLIFHLQIFVLPSWANLETVSI